MAREFRSRRSDAAPTEFKLYYDVPEVEQVHDPESPNGLREQETGEVVEREWVGHYTRKVPGDLMLRIQAGNDITNMVASGEQATAIRELLDLVIVEKDEFRRLQAEHPLAIDMEVLTDLVEAIIEDASKRDPQKPRR